MLLNLNDPKSVSSIGLEELLMISHLLIPALPVADVPIRYTKEWADTGEVRQHNSAHVSAVHIGNFEKPSV